MTVNAVVVDGGIGLRMLELLGVGDAVARLGGGWIYSYDARAAALALL